MKRFVVLMLLILIGVPLVAPFVLKGYFPTHDGQWAVMRLIEMNREIKDFQLPPRWAGFLNHGYGYPLFLFTYPFPYYLGEVLHIIGFGFVDAIKLIFILSIIGSAVTMYIFSGSAIATLFYLYGPYRLVNLFIRGSIGESLAFVWYPLLGWLGRVMVKEHKPHLIGLFAAVFGILIITHNASALLFAPVLVAYLYGVVFFEKNKTILSFFIPIFGIVLGFGTAAYFWLPALIEQQYTVLSTGILQGFDRFVSPLELVIGRGSVRDFPLTIGIFHIIAVVFALGILLTGKHRKQFYFATGILIIVFFFMTPFAKLFWEITPIFSSVDFVWRLLGIFSCMIALVIGYGAKKGLLYQVFYIVLLIGAVWQGIQLFPQTRTYFPDAYYETNDGTTTAFDELMPQWVVQKPRNIWEQKILIIQGNGMVAIEENRSQRLQFNAIMQDEGKLEINTLFFPGWKAYIDDKETEVVVHPTRGTMEIMVPQGTHLVKLQFSNTPIRTIADWITVVSIGIIGLLVVKKLSYEVVRK